LQNNTPSFPSSSQKRDMWQQEEPGGRLHFMMEPPIFIVRIVTKPAISCPMSLVCFAFLFFSFLFFSFLFFHLFVICRLEASSIFPIGQVFSWFEEPIKGDGDQWTRIDNNRLLYYYNRQTNETRWQLSFLPKKERGESSSDSDRDKLS